MVLAHNTCENLRTKDIQISQDVTFDTMLLAENTLQGLKRSGFYKPSPVQLHGIPLGKCGFDLLLEAKSGTGKTAVFSVIALEKLELDKNLQVVILAPTREIAFQIYDVIKQLGINYPGLAVEVVMGGLPVTEDIAKFKKNVHIVVGSPGRLRHLIQDKHIDLTAVRLLVLDEADKLMEKSFLTDINFIFSIMPREKQVIMSSATYPEATKTFINKYVKCAQHVCPDSNCILLGVEQKLTVVDYNSNIVRQTQIRFEELQKILSKKQFKQCLIFCNYHVRVKELYKLLKKEKWPVEQLSGQQEQSDRLEALKTLQEYKCRILISTDLAARGIDASNVDLVINFEPPLEWQTYLHRIGRAGRYGQYGMAITILSKRNEEEKFKKMLELLNLDDVQITNFWTITKPVVDALYKPEYSIKATNDVSSDKNKIIETKFWDVILSGSEIERQYEDFQLLCKSFKESKDPQIESFTDLINSFNTCNETGTEDTVYKILSFKLEHNNNILKTMEEIKDNHEILVTDSNNINKSITESPCELNKINLNNTASDFSQQGGIKDYEKKYTPYSNVCSSIEPETSNRALLDAGFPVCFGQSRKEVLNTNEIKRIKKSNNPLKLSCEYKDTKKNTVRENTFTNTHSYIKNKESHQLSVRAHRSKSNNFYNQEYVNWYKELKLRVNQLELAIYINEITNP